MKIIGALLFAAIAAWGCGAPSAIPPAPCNPSCGVGQSCIAGRCFVEADSSTDTAPDASTDDRSISDTAPDAASEDTADAELDAVVCETTFRDCDRNPANGCEADTQNSRIHCGGCGSSCLMGEVCIRGGCVRPPPPDASADAQCSSFTIANCCGISCTTGAHASAATCSSSGRCGLVCESGFADCDGSVANGCEANLASSTQHCSACGAPCATGFVCDRYACVCPPWRNDCDHNPANGCEVDTSSDRSNCGGCGIRCSDSPMRQCRNGLCS